MDTTTFDACSNQRITLTTGGRSGAGFQGDVAMALNSMARGGCVAKGRDFGMWATCLLGVPLAPAKPLADTRTQPTLGSGWLS
jgi:hypothetical protein